jgi:hypothetical protein
MPPALALTIAILGVVLQFVVVALAVSEHRKRCRAEPAEPVLVLCVLRAGSGYLFLLVVSQRQ